MAEASTDLFADAIVWESPNGIPPAPTATAGVAAPEPDVPSVESPEEREEAPPPEDELDGEAPSEAPGEGEEPVAPDEPAGESRSNRRWSTLTRERALAIQKAEFLEQELTREREFNRERALQRPPVQEAPPPPPAEPFQRDQYGNPLLPPASQFPTQEAYEQAFVAWHREDMRRAILADRQEQEQRRTLEDMRTRHPDFDQVMQGRPLYVSPDVFAAMAGLGKGGIEAAYHLRQHPELQSQYATQGGNDAVMAVARLIVQLEQAQPPPPAPSTPAVPPPPRVSHAPPPITRTRATGAAAPPPDLETVDIMDFITMRNHEEQERRRRW